MKKIRKKFIAVLMLALTLFSSLQNIVFASTEISDAYIEYSHDTGYHLQYWYAEKNAWYYVITSYVEYEHNGQRYPAYCANRERAGVDSGLNYSVNVLEHLNDPRIWRVIKNGYPYQTAEAMGVENNDDAFVATKHAVYSILYDINVRSFYRGGDERGRKIVDAIDRLTNEGRYGKETPYTSEIQANKVGEFKQDSNTNYYSQEYYVSAGVNIKEYQVTEISGFPDGTYVADMSNNAKTNFGAGEHFKILVPKANIKNNCTGTIKLKGKCLTYPMFYGHSPSDDLQNYILSFDAWGDVNGTEDLNIDAYKSKVRVIKTDKETGERLSGITFNAKYEDGTNIGNFTTNNEGIIEISKLRQGKVILTETKTQKHYILDDSKKEVIIGYNESSTIDVTNMHKKGNLKLLKVDKDDNDVTLGAVEFDLINDKGEVVRHLVTDVNGRTEAKDINTGDYILRETLTKKEYKLALDQDITIEWNKTFEIKVENEKKKGEIRIVKVDKDHKEIKLEDVEFQVIDKNNHIIETVKTDKNGEAKTSKLPLGEYKIKEVSLGTNEEYILDEEPKTIIVEEDKIKNIEFDNEHKKGDLKIYKVDLDNEKIPVPDVEFEITDQDGYKYTVKSDKDGIAYIENIRTGIAQIKETKTNKIYKLAEDTYSAEIKWNETAEITIKNEKLKGQIEVYKVDEENKEWKLEGVEFQVINSNNEVVETIKTNKDGYAITSRIPIGEYKFREVKTDTMHILNDEIVKVKVETDIVSKLEITNKRIKGQIKIVKTSEDDNFINGEKAGTPIQDVKFEVYDSNKKLVDEITTDKDGIAITKKLDKGSYTIKEVESGKWYLLNEYEFIVEINVHGEIVQVDITNESEKPDVDIEKEGIIQTTANQEIRYDFKIKNTGNVSLDNFTWLDYLPTDYVRATKLVTGTYNQDLNYAIYYKTNKNDYKLLKDNLNTQVNNYIDFTNLQLEADEYVTEFKAEFGTVDVGFESVVNPYLFVTVNDTVENDDIFTNKTKIQGDNKGYLVWDEDEHTTKVYEKKIEVKLPRTGC